MLKRVSWKYFAIKTKLTSPRIFLWMDSYSNISSNFWPHPSGFWQFRMRQKEPPTTFEMTKVPLFKISGQKNSSWDYSLLLTIWKIWLLGAPEEWHIFKIVSATWWSQVVIMFLWLPWIAGSQKRFWSWEELPHKRNENAYDKTRIYFFGNPCGFAFILPPKRP